MVAELNEDCSSIKLKVDGPCGGILGGMGGRFCAIM
jgi:hypothetical protein